MGLSQEDLELCLVDYPSNLVEFNNDRENMIVIGVKKIDKKIFDDLWRYYEIKNITSYSTS